jgi:4-carboxymuconolactone decarboxylase
VFGPFSVLLRSPELLERTQQLGEFLRFRSVVPIRLRELAILFCGREWEQPYVWFVHEPIARKEGLTPEVIAALAEARQPPNLTDDEQVVYEFSRQLLRTRKVTDQTFQQVKARFGEDGVVELAALHGYFALLAMEMNVARTPLPPEATKPFRDVND